MRDDGSVPPDNPFVGRPGCKPEIYTLGHRNPLGLAFHPVTGELWSTEQGPQGGDELNLIQAGKNSGWPRVSLGRNYDGSPVGGGFTACSQRVVPHAAHEGVALPVRERVAVVEREP